MAWIWLLLLFAHLIEGFTVPNEGNQIDGGHTEGAPVWGIRYQVVGTLQLPYAQIEEPFTSWYDATKNRSRVDFYGGYFQYYLNSL